MARPRKTALVAETTTDDAPPTSASADNGDAAAAAPVKKRRRRRMTKTPATTETGALVEALLRSRGGRGATQIELQTVITWAHSVRDEGDALRELASRLRRPKGPAPSERTAHFEMNRALLDGVLAGSIAIDVQDGGALVFLHGNATAASSANGAGALADNDMVVSSTEA